MGSTGSCSYFGSALMPLSISVLMCVFPPQDKEPLIPEDHKVFLLLVSLLCLLVLFLVLLGLAVLVLKTTQCLKPATDKTDWQCQHLEKEGSRGQEKHNRIMAV